MRPRILAIDDEMMWLQNFKAWIPEDVAIHDSACTTPQAIEALRRYYYHVVLLDLSMDSFDSRNRDNRAIQEYLATRPEATQCIVVSGCIQRAEIREMAFYHDVIFKTEIEPAMLRERVARAIQEASKHDDQLAADAKRKLTDAASLDHSILAALNLKSGHIAIHRTLDTILRRIAPVAAHKNRPHFHIDNDCVRGLVWSRRIGKAVSIVLANRNMPKEESHRLLADWLGYSHEADPVFSQEANRVRMELFEEPSVSDQHFELPQITPVKT